MCPATEPITDLLIDSERVSRSAPKTTKKNVPKSTSPPISRLILLPSRLRSAICASIQARLIMTRAQPAPPPRAWRGSPAPPTGAVASRPPARDLGRACSEEEGEPRFQKGQEPRRGVESSGKRGRWGQGAGGPPPPPEGGGFSAPPLRPLRQWRC